MHENKIEVIQINFFFLNNLQIYDYVGLFFLKTPPIFLFLRVNGDCRTQKIANKEGFKLAVEPEVWFSSWKYLCASCIKLKHCALATLLGLEVEFEVIPPPACHVWIGPTLMTNYWLTEHTPRAQWHQCRGILPQDLRRTKDLAAAFLLVVLRHGGTGREDTLNSLSLDVAVTRGSEVERLFPCEEVTWGPAEVL